MFAQASDQPEKEVGPSTEPSASTSKSPDSPEVLADEIKFASDIQELLNERRSVYESLAGLAGFGVRFGEKTCFDHTNKDVVIGVGQLLELGIADPADIDFIILHELGHFLELAQDTEGYLNVIAEGSREDGLGKTYFGFYNALMDIYVNTNTKNRAPEYSAGENFSPQVEKMYREKFFQERNFTDRPFCIQYSHYLLNLGMGTTDDITLSPEVAQKVNQQLRLFGEEYSHQEFVDTFLRPAIGIHSTRGWQATVSQRKAVIDMALRPIFEALLEQDKQEGRNPEDFAGDPLEGVEPSADDLKEVGKEIQRQLAEANKSSEQKAAEERGKQAYELAKNSGLTPEEAKQFAQTLEKVQPEVTELVKVFKSVVSETVDWKAEQRGHFKTGSTLDTAKAIQDFSRIMNNPERAQVMKRDVYEEDRVEHPKKIRLWLIPDLSSSMSKDEELLQEITVAFCAALATLSKGAELGQHELGGALGVIGFHDSAVDVVPMTDNASLDQIARGYKKLKANGSTSDHTALEQALAEVKTLPEDEDSINILIEITDGETNDPQRSRRAVEALGALGVKRLAFKIGEFQVRSDTDENKDATPVAEYDRGKNRFAQVWNSGPEKLGYYVQTARAVIPALHRTLADYLKEV